VLAHAGVVVRERTLYTPLELPDMSRKVKLLIALVVVVIAWRMFSSEPDVEVEYEVE
jgi:hypothetical protein